MEEFLNKKNTRITIGVFIAAPFTAGALMFGLYGIMFGIGGITSKNPGAFLLGLITISGLVGVAGAWRRLLKPTNDTSNKEQNKIRTMLFYGLASSLALFVISIYFKITEATIILLFITIINVFFIYATPKKL